MMFGYTYMSKLIWGTHCNLKKLLKDHLKTIEFCPVITACMTKLGVTLPLIIFIFLASMLSHFQAFKMQNPAASAPPDHFLKSTVYHSHTTMSCRALLGSPTGQV